MGENQGGVALPARTQLVLPADRAQLPIAARAVHKYLKRADDSGPELVAAGGLGSSAAIPCARSLRTTGDGLMLAGSLPS